MTAIKMFRAGDHWTDRATRTAFPIVLAAAMEGVPITYGDLNGAVQAAGGKRAMGISFRYVADRIGDVCAALAEEGGEPVPPLNAIIVNKETGLPSRGVERHLAKGLGRVDLDFANMTDEARDGIARQAMKGVFEFAAWLDVARSLGLSDPASVVAPPDPRNFARGPESEAHKRLKLWVAQNPGAMGRFGAFGEGRTEVLLSSGDRLDVYFANDRTRLAVEVKTRDAPEDEVKRGVYQCVKYRATLEAMRVVDETDVSVDAVLVLDRAPPAAVGRLAKLLSVAIVDVGGEFV